MHQPITEHELDALGDNGLYHDGGIIDDQNITTALYDGPSGLDQIMKSFDYEGIGKENLRDVVHVLQGVLIGRLETDLSPNDSRWRDFLRIMSTMVSIPLSSLENAEYITDIINVLKRGKFRKCHFRAYSFLMKTVRQIDVSYTRGVGPLYNEIVKLDKQYRENVKVQATSKNQMTSREGKNQMPEDEERESFTASPPGTDNENASSSEEDDDNDDDDDDDVFILNASNHFRGRIYSNYSNGCYICGSKIYERISMGSTLCEGCKMSINKRKRRITI